MLFRSFKQLNIPKPTIYKYIKYHGDTNKIIFNKPTGGPAKISTPEVINRDKNIFDKKLEITIAAVSEKLNIKKRYRHYTKVNKLGYKAHTKKRDPAHIKVQKIRCDDRLPN